MIPSPKLIAASLALEPNRAAVQRDLHRAAAKGIRHVLVNENMIADAMAEVRAAGLEVLVSGLVAFPIGQWVWPAKAVGLDDMAQLQNGPAAVMHGVGPWLDGASSSREEFAGLAARQGDLWVMTSLSAIPLERYRALADDLAACGTSLLILSNGVAASGLALPSPEQITALAKAVAGRFELAAMAPEGRSEANIVADLEAGADRVVSADFWALAQSIPGKHTKSI